MKREGSNFKRVWSRRKNCIKRKSVLEKCSKVRNIASWKLNVKCVDVVDVGLGHVIGQDMWELENICWGVGVEKLMVIWGVGEDDTKGNASLITTVYNGG